MDPWSFDGTKYKGYRQKYTGQLEREVIGLWNKNQTCCLGILCQNGHVSKTVNSPSYHCCAFFLFQTIIYKFMKSKHALDIKYSELFDLSVPKELENFCRAFLFHFKTNFLI